MTDDGWDFEVESVPLNDLGIDAEEKLGMVIVQPEYELEPDGTVPFRLSTAHREAQKELIEKAFRIRAVESEDRDVPIPFVLFPEVSIPVHNPEGLDFLRQQMEQVEEDVIFIGGLEGLSRREARNVVASFVPDLEVAKPAFPDVGSFVNLCVIAVKSANGRLSWHFQAKLRPSQWEQRRNMACGQRVLYFVADHVAFLCQICFDHIAVDGEEPLNTALCHQLVERTPHNAAALDFVFVPQCNPKPDDNSLRQKTSRLLNHQARALKNDMTAVVVVNKAACVQEPSEYGRSGFHYRTGRWHISTSDVGPKGYELYKSDGVTSAIFRKRTPAIHVATLVPPSHNIGNSGNPRQPLDTPRSYLIGNECDAAPCSCLPGTSCPVVSFVECDCLPCKLRDSLLRSLPNTDLERHRWPDSDTDQSDLLASHYDEIRLALLALTCGRAGDLMDLLFLNRKGGKRNPDAWKDSVEVDAVRELAAALSVLRARWHTNCETAAQWTAVLENAVAVAVLDGEKTSHCKALATCYLNHYENYPYGARSRPLLIVALRSTGRVDQIVEEFQPIYSEARSRRPFAEDSPYRPTRVRAFLCRDDLFQEARRAPVLADYLQGVMEVIGA